MVLIVNILGPSKDIMHRAVPRSSALCLSFNWFINNEKYRTLCAFNTLRKANDDVISESQSRLEILDFPFGCLGSLLSQGTFQQTDKNPVRILLFSWSIMAVMITAIYTGHLCADLIDRRPPQPFNSFEELVEQGDFRWTTGQMSLIFLLMMEAPKGSLLNKLYEGMIGFWEDDPNLMLADDMGGFELLKRYNDLVVFGYWSEMTHKKNTFGIDNMMVLNFPLVNNYRSFMFGAESELKYLFDQKISFFMETGIIDNILKEWNISHTKWTPEENDKSSDDPKGSIGFGFYKPLCYALGFALSAALCALIAECLLVKLCSFDWKLVKSVFMIRS